MATRQQATLPSSSSSYTINETSNVTIQPSLTASGNGLFATKHIPAGSTILVKSRPLVGELDIERLRDSCHGCFVSRFGVDVDDERKGRVVVKVCTGCRKVRYCSKTCQKQDWIRTHKTECAMLKDPTLPPLPNAVRATLQLATLMQGNNISAEDKAGINRLQAHDATTIIQPDAVEQYKVSVAAASDILQKSTKHTEEPLRIREYVGKILRNSLTLTTPTLDPIGIALDPIVCTANHSCEPNATVLFDVPKLMLRSLVPIQKGQEVLISYIDTTDPYDRRQAQLKSRYCFTCTCTKCQRGPNEREDEWTQPPSSLSGEKWSSLLASSVRGGSIQHNVSMLQAKLFDDYEKAHAQSSTTNAIKAYTCILQTCKDTTFYPLSRQPYANARAELIPALLANSQLSTALFHMAKLYFQIDPLLYPTPFHPIRVLHTYTLAKTLLLAYSSLNDNGTAVIDAGVRKLFIQGFDFVVPIWRLLRELVGLVAKSHGEQSGVAFMVHALAAQVSEGVGAHNLRIIERDALGMWQEFEKWAYFDV